VIQVQRNASRALLAVLNGRSLGPVLESIWSRAPQLQPGERAAIQDLAYGACRWLGTLRELLAQLLRAPLSDPQVEALLLVALYQLNWTRAAPHAVVDFAVRTCPALRAPGARGLVNAVLRNFLRRREALLQAARRTEPGRYSYPQWWIDQLRRDWPDEYAAILDAGNLHPPMTLRVNRRRADLEDLRGRLAAGGIAAERVGECALLLARPVPVRELPGFEQGTCSVQDLAAQLAAPLLDLSPGQRVLDACAAPGGKSAHILELCDVDLTALDQDAQRLERVRASLHRLGLAGGTPPPRLRAADAAAVQAWWDGRPFDRVLLDAPCTGSGVVRRHPDAKWLRRPQDIAQLAAEQRRLLDALWQTLAPGGKLLYATCSVFAAETRSPISMFLASHDDALRLATDRLAGVELAGGQLLPDARHDGFFYALLQKSAPAAD
jgi:16S rRNA (cytosine967-C5)-methyltransferase